MPSTFQKRLLEAMKIRNMSQIDLVKATGLSKPRISQYVNGTYEAKQQALYQLSKALNVNVSWLMGNDVPMENDDFQSEIEIAELIQKRYGKDTLQIFSEFLALDSREREQITKLLSGYSKLDNSDRMIIVGRIFQIIEDMLTAEKYAVQKESRRA